MRMSLTEFDSIDLSFPILPLQKLTLSFPTLFHLLTLSFLTLLLK